MFISYMNYCMKKEVGFILSGVGGVIFSSLHFKTFVVCLYVTMTYFATASNIHVLGSPITAIFSAPSKFNGSLDLSI